MRDFDDEKGTPDTDAPQWLARTEAARMNFFNAYGHWDSLFAQAVAVARAEPGALQRLKEMPIDEAVEWAVVQMVAPAG